MVRSLLGGSAVRRVRKRPPAALDCEKKQNAHRFYEDNNQDTPPIDNEPLRPFDSMSACHGATGMSLRMLKRAKAAGCPAFRSGRVHIEELTRWLFANPRYLSGFVNADLQKWVDTKLERNRR